MFYDGQLLAELGWNANCASALHFSQCYISRGVHCKSDNLDGVAITARDKAIIHKHMESFATFICLQGEITDESTPLPCEFAQT